ncbi:MAG: DMT family transporter [Microbacteriaceae bacterium]
MVSVRRSIPTWLYFVLAGVVWGSSFMFMKVGLTGMNPAQVAVGRLGFGALALFIMMLITRTPFIRDPRLLGHIAVIGFFLAGLPLLIWAWVGQYLPSGQMAIFNATTPLLTLVLASIFLPSDRMRLSGILGVITGALGLMLVVAPWRDMGASETGAAIDPAMTWIAYAAALGATSCYAVGFVYMRKILTTRDFSPLAFTFAQITAGFVLVTLMALPLGLFAPMALNTQAVAAVLTLGAIGTGIAYVWNNLVVARWGSVRASMVTYVTPVVGVILGALLLAEPLSWNEPVGMLVLFFGIALAQGLIGKKSAAPNS